MTKLKCIFFDLGDTLVHKIGVSPGGAQFQWAPGAKQLLARLARRGMRVGVISNTPGLNRKQLLGLLPPDFSFELFDSNLVILSSEVELSKPDPRIFRLAISRAQNSSDANRTYSTDPAECLFCGESLSEALSAQAAGMQSARVIGTRQPELGTLMDALDDLGFLEAGQ